MDVQQQHMHFRLGVLIAGMMIEREEGGSQFNSFEMESRPPAHAIGRRKCHRTDFNKTDVHLPLTALILPLLMMRCCCR